MTEEKTIKRTIDEININKELYPREKIDQDKVKEYSQYIGMLPPIIINQDNFLIDGFHRYYAHKLAEQVVIECEIIKTIDDDDILLKSIELNAKHGLPLTDKGKKAHCISLYQKLIDENIIDKPNYDIKRLKTVFSIPDSTFSDWTKNLKDQFEGQRFEKILKLYLECKTQQEIADEIGLTQGAVANKIKEIEQKYREILENPSSEYLIKYSFLQQKMEKILEFSPFLYNVWNVSSINNEYKHFGNFPIEFMENMI